MIYIIFLLIKPFSKSWKRTLLSEYKCFIKVRLPTCLNGFHSLSIEWITKAPFFPFVTHLNMGFMFNNTAVFELFCKYSRNISLKQNADMSHCQMIFNIFHNEFLLWCHCIISVVVNRLSERILHTATICSRICWVWTPAAQCITNKTLSHCFCKWLTAEKRGLPISCFRY